MATKCVSDRKQDHSKDNHRTNQISQFVSVLHSCSSILIHLHNEISSICIVPSVFSSEYVRIVYRVVFPFSFTTVYISNVRCYIGRETVEYSSIRSQTLAYSFRFVRVIWKVRVRYNDVSDYHSQCGSRTICRTLWFVSFVDGSVEEKKKTIQE